MFFLLIFIMAYRDIAEIHVVNWLNTPEINEPQKSNFCVQLCPSLIPQSFQCSNIGIMLNKNIVLVNWDNIKPDTHPSFIYANPQNYSMKPFTSILPCINEMWVKAQGNMVNDGDVCAQQKMLNFKEIRNNFARETCWSQKCPRDMFLP